MQHASGTTKNRLLPHCGANPINNSRSTNFRCRPSVIDSQWSSFDHSDRDLWASITSSHKLVTNYSTRKTPVFSNEAVPLKTKNSSSLLLVTRMIFLSYY